MICVWTVLARRPLGFEDSCLSLQRRPDGRRGVRLIFRGGSTFFFTTRVRFLRYYSVREDFDSYSIPTVLRAKEEKTRMCAHTRRGYQSRTVLTPISLFLKLRRRSVPSVATAARACPLYTRNIAIRFARTYKHAYVHVSFSLRVLHSRQNIILANDFNII